MGNLQLHGLEGQEIEQSLFGGNVIATRGELEGDGQYADAIEDLGISGLRYPGGSITEYYFDINDPDKELAIHSETGEAKSIIGLSEFLSYASENDQQVTIVIPTRHYISDDVDENGNRLASVDEAGLRQFIQDTASGVYGDADIRAFEIGNEYWHSGDMNSIEYGRVAADMIDIIDDELSSIEGDDTSGNQIDILVQMGMSFGTGNLTSEANTEDPELTVEYFENTYGYEFSDDVYWSSGGVNFNHITNVMIIDELQNDGVFEFVDGIAAHVYSFDSDYSQTFELEQIKETWLTHDDELDIHATEWNLKGVTDQLDGDQDYGLNQAHEMIQLVETFVSYGVDVANVWPLIQRTDNALSHGFSHDDPNVPGMIFKMMSENLPGKRILDFNADDSQATAAKFDDYSVHGYANQDDLLLYVASEHKEGVLDVTLDLTSLATGYGELEIQILGVADGENPFDSRSTAEIEQLNASEAVFDGFLEVPLDPGEIIQIIVKDFEPSEQMSTVFEFDQEDMEIVDDEDEDFEFPTVPIEAEDWGPPDDSVYETGDGDDGMVGLEWLLALLPLAALLGMA